MPESHEAMTPEKIIELRKSLDCTQEEFSKILGITAVALSRWENGKSRPQERKVKLLDYLEGQLSRGDLHPEQLKRILLVGGAVCQSGVSPLSLLASGLLTEESLVAALRSQFAPREDTTAVNIKGDDPDV